MRRTWFSRVRAVAADWPLFVLIWICGLLPVALAASLAIGLALHVAG